MGEWERAAGRRLLDSLIMIRFYLVLELAAEVPQELLRVREREREKVKALFFYQMWQRTDCSCSVLIFTV